MSDSTNILNSLMAAAIQIRDEKQAGANTAYRVGSLLLALCQNLAFDETALSQYFLRKDKADTAQEIITFLKGLISDYIVSAGFTQGELGSGFVLKVREDGSSYLEIDDLLVRRVAYFVEFVIKSLKHVGGTIVLTPASMLVCQVDEYDSYYRCYFKREHEGRTINQEFVVGDQARSQTFNITELEGEGLTNQFYWRLVVGVGEDYIDLSKSDCATGSMVPMVGDDIVQLGNRDDATRQNAIILSTVGDDAPSIKQYMGINSYALSQDNVVTVFSPAGNIIKGKFYSQANGYDFDEEFDKIRVDWDKIVQQTDKEFTMWFYDYDPTLDNYPASDWSSDGLKALHDQDLFYNTATGKAYRFELVDGVYQWSLVTDQQTIKALEDAAKAQDTADSKRRNFVAQPTPPYDAGDRWSNATYGDLYENDDLVCIRSKAEGEAFSIDDWQPSDSMHSGTKTQFETKIEQLEASIELRAEAHNELLGTVTSLGLRLDAAEENITLWAEKTDANTSSITSLGVRLDAAEENITIWAEKTDANTSSITSLGVRLDAAEENITVWASKTDANTSSIAALEVRADSITSTVTSLQGDLEDAEEVAAAAAAAAQKTADQAIEDADSAWWKAYYAQSAADDAADVAAANATAIKQNADSISAIAGLFDDEGHLLEGSGWVTTTSYAALYSKVYDMDGELAAKAEISTSVQYDPSTGYITSSIMLTADKIDLSAIDGSISFALTGYSFFYLNDPSYPGLIDIRNDEGTCIRIQGYGDDSVGLKIIVQAGTDTSAITSSGNCSFAIRSGESFKVASSNGTLNVCDEGVIVSGLLLGGINTGASVYGSTDFIKATGNITLPSAAGCKGKVVFVKMKGDYTVSSSSSIYKSDSNSAYTSESFNNRALFFISDGSAWYEFTCYSR